MLFEQLQRHQPSRLSQIHDPLLKKHNIELWLKRDDELHLIISGNKWRKLKYIIEHALNLNKDTIISMGGNYSNHLHALAYTGYLLNIKTIGIIRGERTQTPSLIDMQNWGMELRFISRSDYRLLRENKYPLDLKPNDYWLPEGGAEQLALKGVAEIIEEINIPYDLICVACGTGTTLAGLITAANKNAELLGFAAFKHAEFLSNDIKKLLPQHYENWQINHNYHFGGFAKTKSELMQFIDEFKKQHDIQLEPVYTAKMLYGLYNLIQQGLLNNKRIIAIHTGGLQGNRGFNDADAKDDDHNKV